MTEARDDRDTFPTGMNLLHDPLLNKSTAFTEAERDALGLQGLLPPRVCDQSEQIRRFMQNYDRQESDLVRYINLIALQDRNETLFYRVLIDHIEAMMPIVYTPTVGKACQKYGAIFRRSRGIFLARRHRGRVAEVLGNWPSRDIDVIVVTDGERILGLGDLGANGMGIPVGKLSLYTACAGIHPAQTLPVTLDVGTNNEALRENPFYIGDLEPRLRGEAYDALVEEFVDAVQEVFPGALIQFEDFATSNAIRLLARYRDRVCCFNDDIQGTASVALAGLRSATRLQGKVLTDQKILFAGAGSAATGIGELVVAALVADGLDVKAARRRCWFVDSKGLVVASRTDLAEHKRRFAHDHKPVRNLFDAVRRLSPTALVGVSGQPGIFDGDVLGAMGAENERPIVFALSNPTSRAECTAEQAYAATDGRAIFASGSPFDPVRIGDRTFYPGQGNNAYIFPGLGLGVIASGAQRVTGAMFLAAARTLADTVSTENMERGCIYPPLARIRDVSLRIAEAVAAVAYDAGLSDGERPEDLRAHIRGRMYEPVYRSYLAED